MNTARYYLVTFKIDSHLFGVPGTYEVEYDMSDLAEQFAAYVVSVGGTDVEIEEVNPNPDAAAEMVMVQFGPAL